ncbi:MAG: sugar phosphate isomerase/epimerase [Acidobacteria bacterium]|nr:sugar phosphate isomerase/epimerase [Acidobacteriota bacterium]MBI3427447.1 sugar phosphate isomerase/epimerase [Acidobacteriota bacterium]
MKSLETISRRPFLALAGAASAAAAFGTLPAFAAKKLPVGIELYAVRDELQKDLMATVRAVAKLGYEVVEFYAPYSLWTPEYAKEVRKLLDELKIKCLSTHNGANVFTPENLPKAIELNQIIGSQTLVMASAGRVEGLDGWKGVADKLTLAQEKLKPLGMRAGFHNHKMEFMAIEGKRPMDVLAANTPKEVTLQFDVGTCVEAGQDPIAWINANPGRIRSLHLKDWAAGSEKDEKGYRVLFGEGAAPWQKIFAAAEAKGGAEYYLIEQEGSRFGSLETAEKCLATYKKLHA